MKTVYHPTLPVSYKVPDDAAQDWKDQGWRFTRPANKAEADEPVDDK